MNYTIFIENVFYITNTFLYKKYPTRSKLRIPPPRWLLDYMCFKQYIQSKSAFKILRKSTQQWFKIPTQMVQKRGLEGVWRGLEGSWSLSGHLGSFLTRFGAVFGRHAGEARTSRRGRGLHGEERELHAEEENFTPGRRTSRRGARTSRWLGKI